METILDKVKSIMVDRSEESCRQYGPFNESIERAAIIATQLTGLEIGPKDFIKCLVALKLSRMRYNLKEDTMMDGIAYIFGLSEYERECEKQERELPWENVKPTTELIDTSVARRCYSDMAALNCDNNCKACSHYRVI